MNNNDQKFSAQRIRAQYTEKQFTELDELRALDAKVRRPAEIFAYAFGAVGAIVMGAGMSLVMTDIGESLGKGNAMAVGITVGVIGLAMALANFPIFKRIMNIRRDKYSKQILDLSDRIIDKN